MLGILATILAIGGFSAGFRQTAPGMLVASLIAGGLSFLSGRLLGEASGTAFLLAIGGMACFQAGFFVSLVVQAVLPRRRHKDPEDGAPPPAA